MPSATNTTGIKPNTPRSKTVAWCRKAGGALVLAAGLGLPHIATAQALSCDSLVSASQKIGCALSSGSLAALDTLLQTTLPTISDGDLDLVLRQLDAEAFQGNTLAMLGLGMIYETGISPFTQDIDRAANLYLDAAAYGDPEGMLRIAMIYCDGRIKAPDLECLFFLRSAVEFGRADALLLLANALVSKTDDIAGAMTYLEQAVRLGVPDAQAALQTLAASRL